MLIYPVVVAIQLKLNLETELRRNVFGASGEPLVSTMFLDI
jgi:hypothetical protein